MYGAVSSPSSSSTYPSEKLVPPGAIHFDQPRRAFSLPIIKIPFSSPSASSKSIIGLGISSNPMLPLNSPGRSSARRFSYNVKNRASHYALPLTVGGLFTIAFFLFVTIRGSTEVSQFNNSNRLHIYSRGSDFGDEEHQHRIHLPDGESHNGVSLLLSDEDELIAEDDLFWDQYTDPEPKSAEEQAAEAELIAHRQDVLEHDKEQSLRALVWWLAEGGIIPSTWEVPSKQYLRKVGGRGMERLLEDIDSGEEGDEIFDNGWADFAKKRYRIVVFSKTHCPYSKKAKSILGEYRLSPAPFIIELDQRSDMDKLQTLLQRLTGRRTVPNILLDFASIGGSDDITLLHAEGGLQRRFENMEVVPGSHRRRVRKPVKAAVPAAEAVPAIDANADVVKKAEAEPVVDANETPLVPEVEVEEIKVEEMTAADSESDSAEPPAKRARVEKDASAMKRGREETNADRLQEREQDSWADEEPRARRDYNGRVLV